MVTPVSPEALAEVLQAELSRARRMLEVLRLEREALEGRDFSAVEKAAGEKVRIIAALEDLAERQTRLLHAAGITTTGPDVRDALERAGLPHVLPIWDELYDLLARCRQQNLVNGGVIEMSRRFAREVLAALHGTSPGSLLYGRCGETRHTGGGDPLATA